MLKKNKKKRKKNYLMRRATASSGSSVCLGTCNFRLEVMRGSELASILLITKNISNPCRNARLKKEISDFDF